MESRGDRFGLAGSPGHLQSGQSERGLLPGDKNLPCVRMNYYDSESVDGISFHGVHSDFDRLVFETEGLSPNTMTSSAASLSKNSSTSLSMVSKSTEN